MAARRGCRPSTVTSDGPASSCYAPPSPQRTRGVAAQHASLSRWRSPVRIRSGPPTSPLTSPRVSARRQRPPTCPESPPNRCGWQTGARMTRGTASPSHDPETPISGVPVTRPTFAQTSAAAASRPVARRFSKVLVIVLVRLFVLASARLHRVLSGAEGVPRTGTPRRPVAAPRRASSRTLRRPAVGRGRRRPSRAPGPVAAVVPVARPTTSDRGRPRRRRARGPASGTGTDVADLAQASPARRHRSAQPIGPAGRLDPLASIDPAPRRARREPLPGVDPAAIVELRMPFVPVISFWGTQTAITQARPHRRAARATATWDRVLIPDG